eukprot:6198614-Pleurochrysis_carterae.AAC.1
MWDIPRDPIGRIRSVAMLYVVPVATVMETMSDIGLCAISGCTTMIYMGLRAMSEVVLKINVSATASRAIK